MITPVEAQVLRLCGAWRTLEELQANMAGIYTPETVKGAVQFLQILGYVTELPRQHGQPFIERTAAGSAVIVEHDRRERAA